MVTVWFRAASASPGYNHSNWAMAAPSEQTVHYLNHQLDSRRWDAIAPRPGDIVIATAPKVGTTWMAQLIATLIHGETLPVPRGQLVPWVDHRIGPPLDAVIASLEAQTHRRLMRSHLPFDALRYHPDTF